MPDLFGNQVKTDQSALFTDEPQLDALADPIARERMIQAALAMAERTSPKRTYSVIGEKPWQKYDPRDRIIARKFADCESMPLL